MTLNLSFYNQTLVVVFAFVVVHCGVFFLFVFLADSKEIAEERAAGRGTQQRAEPGGGPDGGRPAGQGAVLQ